MSRLADITVTNKTTWTAQAVCEESSNMSAADAQLKLAKRLRDRAEAIERDVDRAASVMAP
jgi:hypothetical protein